MSGLAVIGLYLWDKASIQKVPLRSAKCAETADRPDEFLYDGEFQPLHGRSSPKRGQTHDHCVYRKTYTGGCNALPEFCKLKLNHHLLSLSVL